MSESLKIRREDLYNLVWARPIIQLAKEYNLSDVGLAKICRRNSIPLPPIGYWNKVAHGHIVKMLPLPPLPEGISDTIEIPQKKNLALDGTRTKEEFEDMIVEATGKHFVHIDKFEKEIHPLIVECQKEHLDRLKGYKNLHEGERLNVHNIAVTKSSFERALLLMNMLFQLLELNSLSLSRKPGYGGGTYVNTNGRYVQIALKERTKRSENPDPKSYNKYVFHPTGILYFEIENIYVNGVRKIWTDTATRKLENAIDDVGIGIIIAVILDKKRDQERDEIYKKAEAEREKRQLAEEHQRKERERTKVLLADAQEWHNCNILRGYIMAIENEYAAATLKEEVKSEFGRWIRWAKERADIMDPVMNQSWKKNLL